MDERSRPHTPLSRLSTPTVKGSNRAKPLFKPSESPLLSLTKRNRTNETIDKDDKSDVKKARSILSNVPKVPFASTSTSASTLDNPEELSPRKKRRQRDPNGLYMKAKNVIKAAESDQALFVSAMAQSGPKKAAMKLDITRTHDLHSSLSFVKANTAKLQLTTAKLVDANVGADETSSASQAMAEQRSLEGFVVFSSHFASKGGPTEPLRVGQRVAVWEPLHAVALPRQTQDDEQRNALIVSKWLVVE